MKKTFWFAGKRGFTLVELLTVILILGILSAIAIPQYTRSVRRAEMVEGLTNGRTLFDSAVRYRSVNSVAPTSFDQLDAGFVGDVEVSGSSFNDGNFTYSLASTYVQAHSNKAGYDLRFMFPVRTEEGIFTPIACCPGSSSDGQWLCKNVGVQEASPTPGMPANCYEIKK